jgi:hypothetical protein
MPQTPPRAAPSGPMIPSHRRCGPAPPPACRRAPCARPRRQRLHPPALTTHADLKKPFPPPTTVNFAPNETRPSDADSRAPLAAPRGQHPPRCAPTSGVEDARPRRQAPPSGAPRAVCQAPCLCGLQRPRALASISARQPHALQQGPSTVDQANKARPWSNPRSNPAAPAPGGPPGSRSCSDARPAPRPGPRTETTPPCFTSASLPAARVCAGRSCFAAPARRGTFATVGPGMGDTHLHLTRPRARTPCRPPVGLEIRIRPAPAHCICCPQHVSFRNPGRMPGRMPGRLAHNTRAAPYQPSGPP